MKRKTIALTIALFLTVGLCGCSDKEVAESSVRETSEVTETTEVEETISTTTVETTRETKETTEATTEETEIIVESADRINGFYFDTISYEVQSDDVLISFADSLSVSPEYREFNVNRISDCSCDVCTEAGWSYSGAEPNSIDGIEGMFDYVIYDFDNDGNCELVTFSLVKSDTSTYHSDYLFSFKLDCYKADESGNVVLTDSFDYYPYNYLDYDDSIDMTTCSITSTPNSNVSFNGYINPTEDGATLFVTVDTVSNGMAGDGYFVSSFDLGINTDGEFMLVAADVQHGMGSSDFTFDYYFFDEDGNEIYQSEYYDFEYFPNDIPAMLNLTLVAHAATDLADSSTLVFSSGF